MSTSELDRCLKFLLEIDKLKGVQRATPLLDESRCENSAEHSWHLAMYALVLVDSADQPIDLGRVLQMLLIHDIVEIDAGDVPIHQHNADDPDQGEQIERLQQHREAQAAQRLYGLLPDRKKQYLSDLWQEFEAAESADAQFAKALDRLQPLLHNVATRGGTWTEHGVNKSRVMDVYGPVIKAGSTSLWQEAERRVEQHFDKHADKRTDRNG